MLLTLEIMKHIITTVGIAASVAFISLRSEGKETPVKLDSLPAALQKAITAAVGEGTIQSIASEVEGKQTNYEVAVINGKKKLEHKFSADGMLLETEEAVAMTELPAPVRATFEKLAGNHKILEVVQVTVGEKKFYEADVEKDKGTEEIKVSLAGALISTVMEPAKSKEDADGDKDGDEAELPKK